MGERVKIAVLSFGRGIATFVSPWRRTVQPAPAREPQRGIGRHFAAVGQHLWRAVDQFECEHPEVVANAY